MVNKAQSLPAPKELRVQWSYMNTPGLHQTSAVLSRWCVRRGLHTWSWSRARLKDVTCLRDTCRPLLPSSPREALLLRSGSSTARGFSFSD